MYISLLTKKLLYVITMGDFGGAQKFCYDFCSEFKDLIDITVICGTNGWLTNKLKDCGINVKVFSSLCREISLVKDFSTLVNLWKFIKQEKFDIIFTHSAKAGAIGRVAAKLAGCPKVIYKVGGFAFNEPRNWLERVIYIGVEYILSHLTDMMIFVSKYDQFLAKKYHFHPKRAKLIYNGINIERNYCLSKKWKRRSGYPVLISVGNFYPAKSYNVAVETACILRNLGINFKWLFVGDGPLKDEIQLAVRRRNLDGVIEFTGYLSSSEVRNALLSSDVFILTSSKEGMPFAVLEAMREGLPVIATAVGALPDIIIDGVNGFLVPVGDADALAKKIKKVISNRKLQQEIGKHAVATVTERFSTESMWLQYKDILDV